MRTATDMMARHTHSSVYRLRPNHGVAFLDLEISATELARMKTCFVEETLRVAGHERTVLLPVGREHMFDDGSAWHPETFQPLGANEALWLTGYQGIRPFIGHWLPLPYLRVVTAKATADGSVDQGPLNWVRVFISPPDGPLHEAASLKAVLAIDTQLAGGSRLDRRRYNAPNLEDVSLGSTFVLSDDSGQLAGPISEVWLNDWLREVLRHGGGASTGTKSAHTRFEQEHIARYLFLLQVLCEACAAPILRFAGQVREHKPTEAAATELVLDLSDDVGLAVLVGQDATTAATDKDHCRAVPVRDLGNPTDVHVGALPVRVEFETAPFGYPWISRLSGRSDAFNWSSPVRIGDEANRLALRPNALAGTTGSTALAEHAHDTTPLAGLWRSSTATDPSGKLGPPTRSPAMRHLTETGDVIDASTSLQPALRPRFSRSSLLTLFIAELVLHAVSALNTPRKGALAEAPTGGPQSLNTVRLSLPVSIDSDERDIILERARTAVDLVWRAQGWESDASGYAPTKPAIELGLGGDFGVQMLYLHNQLSDVYGGDLAALIEDLDPVRKPDIGETQALRFASIGIGSATTRTVVADFGVIGSGGIRPRLVAAKTVPKGLAAVHEAVIDEVLLPVIDTALCRADANVPPGTAYELLGRAPPAGDADRTAAPRFPADLAIRLTDKVLRPAARTLVDLYTSKPSDGAHGIERLTLPHLVTRGGGRLETLAEIVSAHVAAPGADKVRWCDVTVPFARHSLGHITQRPLHALLDAVIGTIDVEQTDLIFVASTYRSRHDLRDALLSLLPISPHRLVILDEQWNADYPAFDGAEDVAIPIRAGVLSSVIGKRRLLALDGMAGIEHTLQLESEVA
ncbi:MAG: virulence factor SrfB [Hyphomicrobiaceae bacterium]